MKVIFLDVDGVLNCGYSCSRAPHGCIGVDDDKVSLLKKIVDATGARIVLSSTWKQEWGKGDGIGDDGKYLIRKLAKEQLEIFDITRDEVWDRGGGIVRWIAEHPPVEAWVVLDDDVFSDFESCGVLPHFVKTSFMLGGLNEEHVEKCIRILTDEAQPA